MKSNEIAFEDRLLKKIEYAEKQIEKIQKDLWWYKQVYFMKDKQNKQKQVVSNVVEQLTMFGT